MNDRLVPGVMRIVSAIVRDYPGRPVGELVTLAAERLRAQDIDAPLGELGPLVLQAQKHTGPFEPDFAEPEDRGAATLSELGEVEYVEDLIRPGRIVVWAAEEGSGKSYTVDGELAIRLAVAGGVFAETWPVLRTGPVLVLSEMHADDDFGREAIVLSSLGLERSALAGRYFRLALMTAAGGAPPLTVPEWRNHIADWLAEREAVLLVVDTATSATQVDPWGGAIQAVYAGLRTMTEQAPTAAIVLVVHCRKPQGRGERRLSDVLGEWGRWCDVVVMQENEGGLERTRLTVRKRVRHERRIVATKRGGLLVEVADADGTKTTKVPAVRVLDAITAAPGIDYLSLGQALDVSKDTASRYVAQLVAAGLAETRTEVRATVKGPRQLTVVYPGTAVPPHSAARACAVVPAAVSTSEEREPPQHRTYVVGAVVPAAVVPPDPEAAQ